MNPIFVTKSSMPPFEEYINEIKKLWDNRWLSNRGTIHKQLESELSVFLDAKNVALFANGHVALEVAIDAYNFKNGSEVITTPYTHCSTTHSIVRNNLVPVFCDVNAEDFTIDVSQIKNLITDKTVAIVATHVYGNICDVEKIDEIAQKHNLKVIYDAAHAFGVNYKGIGIANYGDASMFSTHATKVFQTIEGGITVFNDDEIYKKIDHLTNFGFVGPESVNYISTNARMNEFEAAMGVCNLRYIDAEIEKRRIIADKYIELLSGVEGIKLLKPQENVSRNYSYFILFFDGYKKDRNQVQDELTEHKIFARKYFYPIIPELNAYKNDYPDNNTPIAKHASETVLSLPLYSELALEDVERICSIILK